MALPRFLANIAGRISEVLTIQTSAGAGDADKVPATNSSGVLDDTIINAATTGSSKTLKTKSDGTIDVSVLPAGIGANAITVVASESLAANDLVNVWDDAGTPKARKADASTVGKEAVGFVTDSYAAAASATVYLDGRITGLTGLTTGARHYLSAATPGAVTTTPPAASGNVVQYVGLAMSTSILDFVETNPITKA